MLILVEGRVEEVSIVNIAKIDILLTYLPFV